MTKFVRNKVHFRHVVKTTIASRLTKHFKNAGVSGVRPANRWRRTYLFHPHFYDSVTKGFFSIYLETYDNSRFFQKKLSVFKLLRRMRFQRRIRRRHYYHNRKKSLRLYRSLKRKYSKPYGLLKKLYHICYVFPLLAADWEHRGLPCSGSITIRSSVDAWLLDRIQKLRSFHSRITSRRTIRQQCISRGWPKRKKVPSPQKKFKTSRVRANRKIFRNLRNTQTPQKKRKKLRRIKRKCFFQKVIRKIKFLPLKVTRSAYTFFLRKLFLRDRFFRSDKKGKLEPKPLKHTRNLLPESFPVSAGPFHPMTIILACYETSGYLFISREHQRRKKKRTIRYLRFLVSKSLIRLDTKRYNKPYIFKVYRYQHHFNFLQLYFDRQSRNSLSVYSRFPESKKKKKLGRALFFKGARPSSLPISFF